MQVRSLSQEDPLEKEMATHSSILAWRIPWTEEPGELRSIGCDWACTHKHLCDLDVMSLVQGVSPTAWFPHYTFVDCVLFNQEVLVIFYFAKLWFHWNARKKKNTECSVYSTLQSNLYFSLFLSYLPKLQFLKKKKTDHSANVLVLWNVLYLM